MRTAAERDALVVAHMRVLEAVAARLRPALPPHLDTGDLIGWGALGLLEAAERFDPERGVQFVTYAFARVRGAMLDGLREADWIPPSARARQKAGEEALPELVSLDEPLSVRDGDALADLLADAAAADPAGAAEQGAVARAVRAALARLPPRSAGVLWSLYGAGATPAEVAAALGVGVSRVSQLRTRGLAQMRREMGGRDGGGDVREGIAAAVGADEPTEPAAPIAAAWCACQGCGRQVFVCGARLTAPVECWSCRYPELRPASGEDADGDGADEEDAGMARGTALPITVERLAELEAEGASPALVCATLGVTPLQLSRWCSLHATRYPGVPYPSGTVQLARIRDELEGMADAIVGAGEDPARVAPPAQEPQGSRSVTEDLPREPIEWPTTEATVGGPEPAAAATIAAAPPPPVLTMPYLTAPEPPVPAPVPVVEQASHYVEAFRRAARTGALVIPIRIEGARIVLQHPEVEGEITDLEAECVLRALRRREGEPVIVEVEAS